MTSTTQTQKKVLCLGAGLVTAPGVRYLCETGFKVTVASRTLSKAEAIVKGLENGASTQLDVTDDAQKEKLVTLIKEHDLVISLLPWTQHVPVCKLALEHKKHFASTSYISDEMQGMDQQFKDANLVCINEVGVDPGLDHMSAMKIIDAAHAEGSEIECFLSYCGGLPCPDDNNNPFGYKFSWSPKGVLLAAVRVAKYLEKGEEKMLDGTPGSSIYDVYQEDKSVPNTGAPLKGAWPEAFESHPNGDSLKYIPIYGIPEVKTMIRGTYRTKGWCATMKAVTELGLLKETDISALKGKSYVALIAATLEDESIKDTKAAKTAVATKLAMKEDDAILTRLEWLGLFDGEKTIEQATTIDAICDLFLNNKNFWYGEGERDMIAMHHTFIIKKKDGSKVKTTSTMVDYGIKNGDTSMSRTVSLPLAIMVKRILNDELGMVGVVRPTVPSLYNPCLKEMEEKYGVTFVETTVSL